MIDQVDFMKIIENLREDAVVIPTMRAGIGWEEVSNNQKRDIGVSGAMGKASSFALGLSLAQPDTKVIVYDGDGSLLMNLGALVTIGNKAPKTSTISSWTMVCTPPPGARTFREAGSPTTPRWPRPPDTYTLTSSTTWKTSPPRRRR